MHLWRSRQTLAVQGGWEQKQLYHKGKHQMFVLEEGENIPSVQERAAFSGILLLIIIDVAMSSRRLIGLP